TIKEEKERLSGEAERAQRDGDLGRAAELMYGQLPELDRQLHAAEAALAELQSAGAMLKEEVDADEIASVVSSWTGIPAGRLRRGGPARRRGREEPWGGRVIARAGAGRGVPAAVAGARPGAATRTGRRAASCSSARPAWARPSWPRRWPSSCSTTSGRW